LKLVVNSLPQTIRNLASRQIRYQGAFHDPRDGIFPIEDCFNVIAAQRTPEIAEMEAAGGDVKRAGRNIGRHRTTFVSRVAALPRQ